MKNQKQNNEVNKTQLFISLLLGLISIYYLFPEITSSANATLLNTFDPKAENYLIVYLFFLFELIIWVFAWTPTEIRTKKIIADFNMYIRYMYLGIYAFCGIFLVLSMIEQFIRYDTVQGPSFVYLLVITSVTQSMVTSRWTVVSSKNRFALTYLGLLLGPFLVSFLIFYVPEIFTGYLTMVDNILVLLLLRMIAEIGFSIFDLYSSFSTKKV